SVGVGLLVGVLGLRLVLIGLGLGLRLLALGKAERHRYRQCSAQDPGRRMRTKMHGWSSGQCLLGCTGRRRRLLALLRREWNARVPQSFQDGPVGLKKRLGYGLAPLPRGDAFPRGTRLTRRLGGVDENPLWNRLPAGVAEQQPAWSNFHSRLLPHLAPHGLLRPFPEPGHASRERPSAAVTAVLQQHPIPALDHPHRATQLAQQWQTAVHSHKGARAQTKQARPGFIQKGQSEHRPGFGYPPAARRGSWTGAGIRRTEPNCPATTPPPRRRLYIHAVPDPSAVPPPPPPAAADCGSAPDAPPG